MSQRCHTRPNLTQFDNVLLGVDATSSSNAWAVGRADDVSSPFRRPLIQRWNGTSWSIVSSPRPAVDSELRDVHRPRNEEHNEMQERVSEMLTDRSHTSAP
jgi:hypothetical protein